ncbi:putative amine oxidase [copper-containing] [Ruditapes philippinarum]|uniref:putative amine oxidase [copper-containing] n=1 Tax=Ruditapes philippinarum TaxID=129788 RepID=UPI00295B8C5F|nr:putative amine oxidase [copper-containing] [Ruditapes philippinarum]
MSKTKQPSIIRRTPRVCYVVVGLLCFIIVGILIASGIIIHRLNVKISSFHEEEHCPSRDQNINLDPPEVLPPFYDLTKDEILAIKGFLYRQPDLNLVHASEIHTNKSFIYTMELYVPEKEETLRFLDESGPAPKREGKVIIYRGDKKDPFVQEIIVGPLPNPTEKRSEKQRPFTYRPLSTPEYFGTIAIIKHEIENKINHILEESYGGKVGQCLDKCLDLQMITPMSPVSSGEPTSRKIWFWLAPVGEFWSLNPLDFSVLMDMTSTRVDEYRIDKIYYGNNMYNSVDDLVTAYDSGAISKTKIKFPTINKNWYSTMNRRGTLFPEEGLLPPREFEPSGKRYSIHGRHIKYMGWSFDVRMSTMSGPQIFDIRYNNERIAYEMSLQEIAVFYSANSPTQRFADYVDSAAMIGSRTKYLVSGADCPAHSTYLSSDVVLDDSEDPIHFERAFCVFEHNTGTPLRRHLTYQGNRVFYGGMMDTVLTVRTISSLANYDYIIDFIFHQNGAVEYKIISTGYILTSFRHPPEDSYGFRLRDHITGNIHHHMFHVKVDLDIHGHKNRFETIEIVPEEVDNTMFPKSNRKYHQTKMVRQLVGSEKEAALKFDFDVPKYLTFYNKDFISSTGAPRAYRLFTRGTSKQVIKEGTGQEPAISWARYQVAVTKYKETERRSSSVYAMYDGMNPVVDFQSFIDDNETITDTDQVAWVTLGIHHIPHMEDIPVTPTVGLDLGFFLLPYNYFDEDPAMGSGDAIRIEPESQRDYSKGLRIETYGKSDNAQCKPRQSMFIENLKKSPYSIFGQLGVV